jgi:drug/metabolite transporter (DMT)-like permease
MRVRHDLAPPAHASFVSPDVIAAVLLAALVHAGWNAAAKSAGGPGDPLVTTSAIAVGGAIVALPLLMLTGLPASPSHGHVLASGLIHVVYFLLVGLAYRASDYSAVYPITRGGAPLMTSLLAFAVLSETMSAQAWLGVLLLSGGIFALGSDAIRCRGLTWQALAIASLNIGVIVSYTLVDGVGSRRSENPAGYVLAMMALTGLMLLPVIMAWQGSRVVLAILRHWRVGLVGGAMVPLSYGTALWAMTKAPIGAVAALRETSVLFAAVIAAVVLKERFGPLRWIGAAVIVTGLVAMRAG